MTRRKQTKTGMPRTRIISLRVNEDEARELAGLAEQRGVTLSRFLIEAAKQAGNIDKARRDAEQGPVVRELQRIRTEIWRIGHNVNQVAHNTNRDLAVSGRRRNWSTQDVVCVALVIVATMIYPLTTPHLQSDFCDPTMFRMLLL